MGREIDYQHAGAPLRGYFVPGAGDGPQPGVLTIHAWLGITDGIRGRADRIGALGCSAFAADVFGKPVDIAGARSR